MHRALVTHDASGAIYAACAGWIIDEKAEVAAKAAAKMTNFMVTTCGYWHLAALDHAVGMIK